MSSVMPPSISPSNHNSEFADAVEHKEDCGQEECVVNELKGDDDQDVEVVGKFGCHPVESGEVIADQEEIDVDAEEEHVSPEGLRDPGQPSPAERAEHDLTHIPYRP